MAHGRTLDIDGLAIDIDRNIGVRQWVEIPNMTPELESTRTPHQGGEWSVRLTFESWFENEGEWGLNGIGLGGVAFHAVYCPYDPVKGNDEGLWFDDIHGVNQRAIWACF